MGQHAFVDKLFVCFVLAVVVSHVNCFCPRQFEEQDVKEETQHSDETEDDVTSNSYCKPLNNLAVKVQGYPGLAETPNWDYLPTDLNAGNPESYVYAGMQFGYNNPIGQVDILYCDDAEKLGSKGWECSVNNLNHGVSGAPCLSLCWKRADDEMKPIKNLFFLTTADSKPPKIPGWTHFGMDTNYKTRSSTYVWGYYSKIVPFCHDAAMLLEAAKGEEALVLTEQEAEQVATT